MTEDIGLPDLTAVLQRQLVLDLVPCGKGQQAINSIGMVPASTEGAEVEHIMSHARLDKIAPINGPIQVYSAMVAEIWTKLFLTNQPEGMIPETFHGQIYEAQVSHIYQATAAILANMIDSGILSIGQPDV